MPALPQGDLTLGLSDLNSLGPGLQWGLDLRLTPFTDLLPQKGDGSAGWGGGESPKREMDLPVWFEARKQADLGSVDSLKADTLRIGMVGTFLQPVFFSSAVFLEGRLWGL